jgi:hypothetical protein
MLLIIIIISPERAARIHRKKVEYEKGPRE